MAAGVAPPRLGAPAVYVFRHCVRSTVKPGKAPDPEQPMPDFGTPPEWCTENGAEIARRTGQWLRESEGVRLQDTRIYGSGNSKRCVDTAALLMAGLAEGDDKLSKSMTIDAALFHAAEPKIAKALCRGLTDAERAGIVEQQNRNFAKFPMPSDLGTVDGATRSPRDMGKWREMLAAVEASGIQWDLASHAGEPIFFKDPGSGTDGELQGLPKQLKTIGQNLFYTWASGLRYANATDQLRRDVAGWEQWEHGVAWSQQHEAAESAPLLEAVLRDLAAERGGTSLYVGHDSNQAALRLWLNLTWGVDGYYQPYPPTFPGSALRFRRGGAGDVSIDYVYTDFDGTVLAPRKVVGVVPGLVSLEELRARADAYGGSNAYAAECRARAGDYIRDLP